MAAAPRLSLPLLLWLLLRLCPGLRLSDKPPHAASEPAPTKKRQGRGSWEQKRVVLKNGTADDPFQKVYHWDDWVSGEEAATLNLSDPICVTDIGGGRAGDLKCKLISQKLCGPNSKRPSQMQGGHARCLAPKKSCAVVGSSSNLLSAKFGQFIDSHDFVIRINAAPAGSADLSSNRSVWRDHVGTRTDARFVNLYGHLPEVRESKDPMCLFLHEPYAPDNCGKWCWRNPGFCNVTCTRDLTKTPGNVCIQKKCHLTDFSCRAKYQKHPELMKNDHVILDSLYSGVVDQVVPHSTAGFKAVIYAMSTCDKVSILGFGPSCQGAMGVRYYSSGAAVHQWHHYDEELALMKTAELKGTRAVIPPEARNWIKAQSVQLHAPSCVKEASFMQQELSDLFQRVGADATVNLRSEVTGF